MRQTEISRKTKETDIKLSLCLEGGDISIDTGIGFFDHMLNSFATHAGFGLELEVKGDLYVYRPFRQFLCTDGRGACVCLCRYKRQTFPCI